MRIAACSRHGRRSDVWVTELDCYGFGFTFFLPWVEVWSFGLKDHLFFHEIWMNELMLSPGFARRRLWGLAVLTTAGELRASRVFTELRKRLANPISNVLPLPNTSPTSFIRPPAEFKGGFWRWNRYWHIMCYLDRIRVLFIDINMCVVEFLKPCDPGIARELRRNRGFFIIVFPDSRILFSSTK